MAPIALIAVAADVLVFTATGHVHRVVGTPADPPAPAQLIQAPMHTQPDLADYNTILTERSDLGAVAKSLLLKITTCERTTADPYGGGLMALNNCLSARVRENILRARVEPMMFTGVMRNMQAGACAELTSGLMEGLAQLGEASYAWNADVEVPGTAPGRQEYSDVRELRQIAGQIVHVAGSGAWRTACHPRPYDQAEHGGTATGSRPGARTPGQARDQRLVSRRAV